MRIELMCLRYEGSVIPLYDISKCSCQASFNHLSLIRLPLSGPLPGVLPALVLLALDKNFGAVDGNRTRNLFRTKEVQYHCATTAGN